MEKPSTASQPLIVSTESSTYDTRRTCEGARQSGVETNCPVRRYDMIRKDDFDLRSWKQESIISLTDGMADRAVALAKIIWLVIKLSNVQTFQIYLLMWRCRKRSPTRSANWQNGRFDDGTTASCSHAWWLLLLLLPLTKRRYLACLDAAWREQHREYAFMYYASYICWTRSYFFVSE